MATTAIPVTNLSANVTMEQTEAPWCEWGPIKSAVTHRLDTKVIELPAPGKLKKSDSKIVQYRRTITYVLCGAI